MPHSSESKSPSSRSENPSPGFQSSASAGTQRGQFTESKQSSTQGGVDLKATDPFPPGLFRVPVPNAVLGEMPHIGDAALRCLLALAHLSWRFDPEEKT